MADVGDNEYGEGQLAEEVVARLKTAAAKKDTRFSSEAASSDHICHSLHRSDIGICTIRPSFRCQEHQGSEGAPSYAPQFGGELRAYADIPSEGILNETDTRRLIHGYYAATSYMDAQVGKILDTLDAMKLWDNTIVLCGAITVGISVITACGVSTPTTSKRLVSRS